MHNPDTLCHVIHLLLIVGSVPINPSVSEILRFVKTLLRHVNVDSVPHHLLLHTCGQEQRTGLSKNFSQYCTTPKIDVYDECLNHKSILMKKNPRCTELVQCAFLKT